MNILIISSEYGLDGGGLALHCAQLKKIMETLGHKVYVEEWISGKEYFVLDGGYDPDLGNKMRTSYTLKSYGETYGGKVDICISCGAGKTGYISMIFCKENKIPLYVVLCGSEVNLAFVSPGLAFYNAEALSYASAVIGLSDELNRNAQCFNRNNACRYYIIPNYYTFVERNSFVHKNLKASGESITFASGATFLGEKKGIANLLIAFDKVINEKGRTDKLYLFGKIDEDLRERYEEIIREYSLQNHVLLCGYLDRESFHRKMKEVDTYIQASPFEGLGNSVAETIGIGKDVLISNTGFIAESIAEEFPDHIIKSLMPEEIASSICNYVKNVYQRKDADLIRSKLEKLLDKSRVIELWKGVLKEETQIPISIGSDSCLAVMFHDIGSDYSGIEYSTEGFSDILNHIQGRGLRLCSVQEFMRLKNPDTSIICTFDDGYENVYKKALPVMKKHGFTATVYICPDLIGKDNSWNHKDSKKRNHLSDEMLKEIKNEGWEIGSHGLSHINMLRLSEKELDITLSESKRLLGEYGPIESFCYPYGEFNSYIKDKVKKYYKNSFSVSIGGNNYENDMYQITRLTPEELIMRLGIDR